jgi:RimJ/RimL family protein N-acetyltransferase
VTGVPDDGAPSPGPPLAPVTLDGRHVRLEPLEDRHVDALWAAGQDPALWTLALARMATRDDMHRYVDAALDERARGTTLPFALIAHAEARVVGSTRLGSYDPRHRRVEIGWTWVAGPWQRTAVNTEAKRLLLAHAFDALGVQRVEFRVDALNVRSREAVRRLGAVEEGTLRRHMVTHAGRVRDTVSFSIVADEWPAVRATLDARLARA